MNAKYLFAQPKDPSVRCTSLFVWVEKAKRWTKIAQQIATEEWIVYEEGSWFLLDLMFLKEHYKLTEWSDEEAFLVLL